MIGYVAIFNDVAKSQRFHGFGYTRANIGQLTYNGYDVEILDINSDFSKYHTLWVDEGVNFTNLQWNKPGGDFSKTIPKLKKLANYGGKILHSKYKEFPDYNDLIKKRKLTDNFSKEELTNLKNLKPTAVDLLQKENLILGDSHATSVYENGWSIQTINGKTLWSFLNDGLSSFTNSNTKKLRFYAGNIDIRFHFYRLNVDLTKMAYELETQLASLNIDIELVQPLPIEDESRTMSSTMGSYKGKPFYGTQIERGKIRDIWSILLYDMCERHNWTYLTWPEEICDESGWLRLECMEPKRGPHLSPTYYLKK